VSEEVNRGNEVNEEGGWINVGLWGRKPIAETLM
jgi:hypothetical protein